MRFPASATCEWKSEHQVRKYLVKGLISRNMAGRERDGDRFYEGAYKKRMKKKEQKIRNAPNLQKKQISLNVCM